MMLQRAGVDQWKRYQRISIEILCAIRLAMLLKRHIYLKVVFKENISFGKPDATMDEIEEAAKIAQAKEFIEVRDHQYEDEISEDGTNVSGWAKTTFVDCTSHYHGSIFIYL